MTQHHRTCYLGMPRLISMRNSRKVHSGNKKWQPQRCLTLHFSNSIYYNKKTQKANNYTALFKAMTLEQMRKAASISLKKSARHIHLSTQKNSGKLAVL